MTTQWYFATIEEAKAAMPEWECIFKNGGNDEEVNEYVHEHLVGKFIPVDEHGIDLYGQRGLHASRCWVIAERRMKINIEQIVDQIRNAETRDEAIRVARGYHDDTEYFGEDIIR